MTDPLLQVDDLKMHFPVKSRGIFRRVVGQVRAVDGISLHIDGGETLGLVGESGCGKSTAGRSIMRLLEPTGGKIILDGADITKLSRRQMVPHRRTAQMIFQDPYSALNPRHTVGSIIGAPFIVQKVNPVGGVRKEVQELMARVGLNPEHYNRYPNEFSGGQRQRIGIARALALKPKLIVCDEPVSALDVSIQAQVINLLQDLQQDFGLAYLFVAHDLSVVRQISHRISVMYLGHIMETASRDVLYSAPQHPYTHALMSAVPVPNPLLTGKRERIMLQGDLPSPINPPTGCVFNTRCFKVQDRCRVEVPALIEVAPGHQLACHFPITESLGTTLITGPNPGLTAQPDNAPDSPNAAATEAVFEAGAEPWAQRQS